MARVVVIKMGEITTKVRVEPGQSAENIKGTRCCKRRKALSPSGNALNHSCAERFKKKLAAMGQDTKLYEHYQVFPEGADAPLPHDSTICDTPHVRKHELL